MAKHRTYNHKSIVPLYNTPKISYIHTSNQWHMVNVSRGLMSVKDSLRLEGIWSDDLGVKSQDLWNTSRNTNTLGYLCSLISSAYCTLNLDFPILPFWLSAYRVHLNFYLEKWTKPSVWDFGRSLQIAPAFELGFVGKKSRKDVRCKIMEWPMPMGMGKTCGLVVALTKDKGGLRSWWEDFRKYSV